MMKKTGFFLALIAGIICTGCVNVEYVGQRFAPLPDTEYVNLREERADLPAGEYQVIGRAEVTAPADISPVDLQEKLRQEAREIGADAVQIVSRERRLLGRYYRQPEARRHVTSAQTGSISGTRAINSFGEEVSLDGGSYAENYELCIKTLFLMKTTRYQEEMAKRKEIFQKRLEQEQKAIRAAAEENAAAGEEEKSDEPAKENAASPETAPQPAEAANAG